MSGGWNALWDARAAPEQDGSVMSRLMKADGLDSGFARVPETAWHEFVSRSAMRLGLAPGSSVFEVGCGAGAFLFDLWSAGVEVGGIDRSPALVALASEVMPGASFEVRDAAEIEIELTADAVISNGVFMYFSSHEYAAGVISRMAAKARRVVAVLDIPDASMQVQALAAREAEMGGSEPYAARYAGLEHLYYERDWFAAELVRAGLIDVQTADHDTAEYANASFRFHAWGYVPHATRA